MSDADWLTAIAAAPDEPLVRLTYADFLDDHGDPRAELLRLDVALFDRPTDDPRSGRLRELAGATDVAWLAAVCRVPLDIDWDGESPWYLVDSCDCPGPARVAPDLFAVPTGRGHEPTRGPRTPAEVAVVCRAARACGRQMLRYSGIDPVVIGLLGNDPDLSDFLIDADRSAVYLATADAIAARRRGAVRPAVPAAAPPRPAADGPARPWGRRRRNAYDPPTDTFAGRDWTADELVFGGCLTAALAALVILVALAYHFQPARMPHV